MISIVYGAFDVSLGDEGHVHIPDVHAAYGELKCFVQGKSSAGMCSCRETTTGT